MLSDALYQKQEKGCTQGILWTSMVFLTVFLFLFIAYEGAILIVTDAMTLQAEFLLIPRFHSVSATLFFSCYGVPCGGLISGCEGRASRA